MTDNLNNPMDRPDDGGPDVIDFEKSVDSILGLSDGGNGYTAPNPHKTWVPPMDRRQRLAAEQALNLPNRRSIGDLQSRVSNTVRLGTVSAIESTEKAARDAVMAAYEAYDGAHDETAGRARDVATKDAVVAAIADATRAVGALERAVADHADEILEALTADLDAKREQAIKDLKAALASFSTFRATVRDADQFGIDQGRWDRVWNTGVKTPHELTAASGAIAEAIKDLQSTDGVLNGMGVVTDYGDAFPDGLLALWKRGADLVGPGSFPEQVWQRAIQPHKNDKAAQEALATKRAITLTNAEPISTEALIKGLADNPAGFVAPVDKSKPKPSSQKAQYTHHID